MITRYKNKKVRRKARVKGKVSKTLREYRLVVRRSNKYIMAQMVKLATGETLFSAVGRKAEVVGKSIAEKSAEAKISKVVFDRGENRFHGNIRKLADAARGAGLKF